MDLGKGLRRNQRYWHKELILTSFENKLQTLVVFVHFSKAFDQINHVTLLTKLEYCGFRGVLLDLPRSYLQFRSLAVIIDNSISASKPSEVPQGSILGTLLFIIYINDNVNISASSKFVIYADTTLFFKEKDPAKLMRDENDLLATVNVWGTIYALQITTTKTKVVLFRPKNAKACIDGGLHIAGSPVSIASHFKSLGVYFEEHMNWNKHVEIVVVELPSSAYEVAIFLTPKNQAFDLQLPFFSHLNYCLLV